METGSRGECWIGLGSWGAEQAVRAGSGGQAGLLLLSAGAQEECLVELPAGWSLKSHSEQWHPLSLRLQDPRGQTAKMYPQAGYFGLFCRLCHLLPFVLSITRESPLFVPL